MHRYARSSKDQFGLYNSRDEHNSIHYEKGGFHLIELHLPTIHAGLGFLLLTALVSLLLYAICRCYKKKGGCCSWQATKRKFEKEFGTEPPARPAGFELEPHAARPRDDYDNGRRSRASLASSAFTAAAHLRQDAADRRLAELERRLALAEVHPPPALAPKVTLPDGFAPSTC